MPTVLPPLRVFLSSTDIDLHEHRTAVIGAILRMQQFPIDMRYFNAQATGTSNSNSVERVGEADVVILLIAWRYGSVQSNDGLSITHEEYREAVRLGKPILAFLADKATETMDRAEDLFPLAKRDPDHADQMHAFRQEVKNSGRIVDTFDTPADLGMKVAAAIGGFVLQYQERYAHAIPRNLPPRATSFVGRAGTLREIEEILHGDQSVSMAVAITGLGGIGKSALAAELISHITTQPEDFPGGYTWVRCDDKHGLDGLAWFYDQILSDWEINLDRRETAQAITPAAAVEIRERALLNRLQPAGGALVLLDNIEHDFLLTRALEHLISKRITVLATTRSKPHSPHLRIIHLDTLTAEQSLLLFIRRYINRGGTWIVHRDSEHAEIIVNALGWLPLAIELAAARAAYLPDGLQKVADELRQPEILTRLGDPVDSHASVRYSLTKSLEGLSLLQRTHFAALSLPNGPDISRRLAEFVFDTLGTENGRNAAVDIDLLNALSLITLVSDMNYPNERIRLHPLVKALAHDIWENEDQTNKHAGLTGLINWAYQFAESHQEDFASLAKEETTLTGAIHLAANSGRLPEVVSNIVDVLWPYISIGSHFFLGEELLHLQLEARQQLHDRLGEAVTRNSLGQIARSLGQLKAAETFYNEAFAIYVDEKDQRGIGVTLNNKGALALDSRRMEEAKKYFKQALKIFRQEHKRYEEGATLNNLGGLALELERNKKARRYYQLALAVRKEINDEIGEGETLLNLAVLATDVKANDEAKSHLIKAWNIFKEKGSREREAIALDSLGLLAINIGEVEMALTYLTQAVTIRRDIGDRWGEGITLNNLGELNRKQGNYESAESYYQQALTLSREVNNPQVEGAALNNLGLLAVNMRKTATAAAYYEQALAIRQRANNQRGEAETLDNLGNLAKILGKPREANMYFAQAQVVRHRIRDLPAKQRRKSVTSAAKPLDTMSAASPSTPPHRFRWPWQRRTTRR
jgi:tetratricopeptide (TPR) repeat protein